MIGGSLLLIIGVQVVALGLCALAYGVYFMAEQDDWFDRMRARFRLEHGLMLGGSIMLAGIILGGVIVVQLDRPRLRQPLRAAARRPRGHADHGRHGDLLHLVPAQHPRPASTQVGMLARYAAAAGGAAVAVAIGFFLFLPHHEVVGSNGIAPLIRVTQLRPGERVCERVREIPQDVTVSVRATPSAGVRTTIDRPHRVCVANAGRPTGVAVRREPGQGRNAPAGGWHRLRRTTLFHLVLAPR